MNYSTLTDAYVLPSIGDRNNICSGGVANRDGEFLKSSMWHEGCKRRCGFNKDYVLYRNESVIYIGCLFHVWGHAITDNLKKIWYLWDRKDKPKLVYITYDNKQLPEYVYELFDLADINLHEAEQIYEITQFREIIVPDNSIVNIDENRYYTEAFKETIERILVKIPIRKDMGPVYFTRTHLLHSRDIGERNIERAFHKRGYTIIAPEELTVKEQLSICVSCTSFASTEGSISHSTLFCRPGTKVIILRKVDYVNPYTNFINEMRSLNVTFIKAHHSILASKEKPWQGPFYLYITSELSRHLGNFGWHLPYYVLWSWYEYRYGLNTRLKVIFYGCRARLSNNRLLKRIFRK